MIEDKLNYTFIALNLHVIPSTGALDRLLCSSKLIALTVKEYTVPELNELMVADNCDVTTSDGILASSSSDLVEMM